MSLLIVTGRLLIGLFWKFCDSQPPDRKKKKTKLKSKRLLDPFLLI